MRSILRASTALAVLPLSLSFAASVLHAQPNLPPGEFAIRGRVLGPDGAPAAEAQVLVLYTARDQRPRTLEVATGPDGSFVADAEPQDAKRAVYALARKPGLALDWAAAKPGDPLELKLGPDPVTFSGTVKGPDGAPLAGASVRVHCLSRPSDARPTARRLSDDPGLDDFLRNWFFPADETFLAAVTDEQGRFAVPDLPGYARLRVTVTCEGRERLRMEDETLPADTHDFVATLAPEATIGGQITHEGRGLPDVRVDCLLEGHWIGQTVTAPDGTYSLRQLSAGTYQVGATPPGDLAPGWAGPLVLEAGQAARAHMALTPGALIRGTVTDAGTGRPLAGASVAATAGPRQAGSATTDEQGAFALRTAPGRYEVRCSGLDWETAQRVEPVQRTVKVAEGEVVEGINFVVPAPIGHQLRGRVVDAGGEPVPGARVGGPDGIGPVAGGFLEHFPAVTGADGTFEFEVGRPEDQAAWPVLAIEPDRGLAGLALQQAKTVSEDPIEIALSKGGWIAGTVVDTEGRPVAAVPLGLTIYPLGQGLGFSMGAGQTDANGAYSVGPLPAGPRYELGPTGRFAQLVVAERAATFVGPEEDSRLEPIVVNLGGRSLKGTVLDAQLRPVAYAIVCVTGNAETARTDADGRFEIGGLPAAGRLWMVALHPHEPLVWAESVDPGWGLEPGLVLLPTGSAVGRLLDQDGKPVADATLEGYPEFPIVRDGSATYAGQAWDGELRKRLGQQDLYLQPTTDAGGRWRADGLIRGAQYVFWVKLPDGTAAGARYRFTVGEQGDTDAGDLKVTAPRP